jgi:hypothetical protein
MPNSLPWTPWHDVVELRDDIRSGELTLAAFAADLYDVAMRAGRRAIYEDPREFFALTYPTYNLRELARDVARRLAGRSGKAIRQLELTYGGGKTHALITLYHLFNAPARLPDLPAVDEFVQHIGMAPPQARIVVLPFDKLDVEKGMEIRGPDGAGTRWLRHPWSLLAYQIAGSDGLRLLHAAGEDTERESAPAENLLLELLRIPEDRGEAVLILIDEVLMYAREKVGLDPAWRGRLLNFFQVLTQAVTKVDHCAMVASLLATDPRKSDQLGKELTQELYTIFRRESEKGVQPVQKTDVAEVLRRRFFTPDSIQNREAFRSHVVAALQGIQALDEQTAQAGQAAESRFLQSYPFHPDLTEVFYTKWTNLEGFQRTRGVLRTFALALREAEAWDTCPLIGANVFLAEPGLAALSEAARELTSIAEKEEYEGRRQEWSAILLGELGKARVIQEQVGALHHREIERAVWATFMHSQPVGQRALTRDLMLLLGQTRPDTIELEKALHRWIEVSWFLDEEAMQADVFAEEGALPRAWRLGTRPNLQQMHHDACENRVSPDLVDTRLVKAIRSSGALTLGAAAAGAKVHMMPDHPKDVKDDGAFHYVILPPEGASAPDRPSELAQRFLLETTRSDRPRVNKNMVVLVAPSVTGLAQARQSVLTHLGWEAVRDQLKTQKLAETEPLRWEILLNKLGTAKAAVPGAIRQAYSVVVTFASHNVITAFRVVVEERPLFATIKADRRARIQETAVSAEALLPGGPYDLWREGEEARWLKDLVGAFAENPSFPKMLNPEAIHETLIQGCEAGHFVFRLRRSDGTVQTFWRTRPPDALLDEGTMAVVLPEAATLTQLDPSLLAPGRLPGLWQDGEDAIEIGRLYDYVSGDTVIEVEREGYTEPVMIPAAPDAVVDEAVKQAVARGILWLRAGPASLWQEEVPPGVLSADARLLPPPDRLSAKAVLPASLPHAWADGRTTVLSLSTALSQEAGEPMPWRVIAQAVRDALAANYLDLAPDSGPWPCNRAGAQDVRLRVPQRPPPPPPPDTTRAAEAELAIYELQDLADVVGALVEATSGYPLTLRLRVELGENPPDEVVEKANKVLGEVSEDLTLT